MTMRQIISPIRSDAQLIYHSRFFTLRGSLLVNSIPKSGTHLFKAILQGMGYRFLGHIGSKSKVKIALQAGGNGFFTGHTRALASSNGNGKQILTVRDPAAIALSLVHYSADRKDHHRHTHYQNISLEQAMIHVLKGSDDTYHPLSRRFETMLEWAERSNASIVDFDDVRARPEILAEILGSSPCDNAAITSHMAKWNPTKRVGNRQAENAFLDDFKAQHPQLLSRCDEVYQHMKSLRTYDL